MSGNDEIIGNGGRPLDNILNDDDAANVSIKRANANIIDTQKTIVNDTAKKISLPDSESFLLWHETEDAILHYSSNTNVSATDPRLQEDDVIEVSARKDIEIYMISESGPVVVFAQSLIKE